MGLKHPSSPRRWTPEEDVLIRNFSHLTARQLAARLGRSLPAVETRRSALGIRSLSRSPRGRRRDPEMTRRIVSLYEQGATHREIAGITGFALSAVNATIRYHRIGRLHEGVLTPRLKIPFLRTIDPHEVRRFLGVRVPTPRSLAMRAQVVTMHRAGLSTTTIGERLGISQSYASRLLREEGIFGGIIRHKHGDDYLSDAA